jgi:predicted small integral membrane protein
MVACLALFALLVATDNVVDYASNYAFVRHVLSMDMTFPGNALRWRAVTSPALWTAGYWLIIAGEALTGLASTVATVQLLDARRSCAEHFAASKAFAHIGGALGFLVWFLGFMVIGGEWFSMWQSPNWNDQQAAFRFYETMLVVLVYVAQPDRELNPSHRELRPSRPNSAI